jgi:glucosamine 6-phosphate synthetase-like amidotransferase/phosphosugar isomerase protein
MCGICFASFTPESTVNIREIARVLLREMEKRGNEATGVACFDPTSERPSIITANSPIPARDFVQSRAFRRGLADTARVFIGHTRLATQGDKRNLLNNHPVLSYATQGEQVAAVHNGMIYNDHSSFAEFDLTRYGQVDSEIIPAMVAAFGSDEYASIFNVLEGGIATAWLDERTPDVLHCVRASTSPMVVLHLDAVNLRAGGTVTGVVGASTENALDLVCDLLGIDYDGAGVTYYTIPEGAHFTVTNGVWNDGAGTVHGFDLPDMRFYGRGWRSAMSSATGGGSHTTSTTSSSVSSSATVSTRSYGERAAEYDEMDWEYDGGSWRGVYDPSTGTMRYGDPDDRTPLALDDALGESDASPYRSEGDRHYAANLAVQLDLLRERMEDESYVLSSDDRVLIAESTEYSDLLGGSVSRRLGLPSGLVTSDLSESRTKPSTAPCKASTKPSTSTSTSTSESSVGWPEGTVLGKPSTAPGKGPKPVPATEVAIPSPVTDDVVRSIARRLDDDRRKASGTMISPSSTALPSASLKGSDAARVESRSVESLVTSLT